MNDNLLEIKNLIVTYRTDESVVQAINDITLSVKKGRTLGLVGETGAGKTTTSMAVLRLLPDRTAHIEGGEIYFNGENLLLKKETEMEQIRGEKISMIFQDPMSALNPTITIGDQIAEALELHNRGNKSKSEIQERVRETLEMVGIPAERANEFPHQFSGGMKQRVVIAIALACEPQLLIADEPTTALDVTIQAQVLAMMNELQEKLQMSMIMITHDMGIVAQTCDDVAVMYAGEIIEYGSAEDVFTGDRHHPYTKGLFDSIPNLKENSARLKPIPGLMPDPTNLPAGCKFSPRCPYCRDICKKENPAIISENGHQIKCHLFNERREDVQ